MLNKGKEYTFFNPFLYTFSIVNRASVPLQSGQFYIGINLLHCRELNDGRLLIILIF